MINIALFDFDGTITKTDTSKILIIELLKYSPLRFFIVMYDLIHILLSKDSETVQRKKNKIICKLTKRLKEKELQTSINCYSDKVESLYRKEVFDAINELQKKKILPIIVTASPEFAVNNVFKKLNIKVIGTKFDICDGKFTGKLSSLNCYGDEKTNRIQAWVSNTNTQVNILECWGDSIADYPMMLMAQSHFWVVDKENLLDFKKIDPNGIFLDI